MPQFKPNCFPKKYQPNWVAPIGGIHNIAIRIGTFSKKGFAEFEVFKGQESYKIKPFTKSNAWGVFREGVSNFKKGSYIQCYSSSGFNEFLIN